MCLFKSDTSFVKLIFHDYTHTRAVQHSPSLSFFLIFSLCLSHSLCLADYVPLFLSLFSLSLSTNLSLSFSVNLLLSLSFFLSSCQSLSFSLSISFFLSLSLSLFPSLPPLPNLFVVKQHYVVFLCLYLVAPYWIIDILLFAPCLRIDMLTKLHFLKKNLHPVL